VEENTIKEVKEEAGLDVKIKRVIAVQDREKHNLPIYAYKVCKIFMQCDIIGGEFTSNIETTGFDYFGIDDLSNLSLAEEKNNKEQIEMCFKAMRSEHWEALFD
jgi:ADP-ribose pyrophosphatase YjhB (NUDIX family)